MKKLFIRLTSASFVVVMLLVTLAVPAFAATHAPVRSFTQQGAMTAVCNDDDATCDGQNPFATVGPDGQPCATVGQQPIAVADNALGEQVALFYSQNCETNWSVYQGEAQGIVNANVQRLNSDGSITEYDTTVESSFGAISPMVFAPVLTARACGSENNDPATSLCTGFF